MKNILHYGLQRTGTNYLETLLKKKFKIKILNDNSNRKHPLQKHFRLYDNKLLIPEPQYENNLTFNSFTEYEKALGLTEKIDAILIITKDPYSWYISYLNWAKKCNWPKTNYNYIEEYNSFYKKWMDFSKNEPRILFVKYIDLINNQEKELKKIQDKFNLPDKLFRNIFKHKIKIRKVPRSKRFSEKRLKFYTEKEYLKQFKKSDLDIINSIIDTQLMNDLKYEIEL